MDEITSTVYELLRDIRDPEKPETLEELNVVYEDGVRVTSLESTDTEPYFIQVTFTPTVPHCSLATLIGLCIRVQLQQNLPYKHKLDISIKEGTHSTEAEINKQINDKERVAAAMENPELRAMVLTCLEVDNR